MALLERLGEEAVGPADHHLVGLGKPQPGGEHSARVAHRHVIAEELADPGHRGRKIDRAEHEHPRRWRERLDEHTAVVEDARSAAGTCIRGTSHAWTICSANSGALTSNASGRRSVSDATST